MTLEQIESNYLKSIEWKITLEQMRKMALEQMSKIYVKMKDCLKKFIYIKMYKKIPFVIYLLGFTNNHLFFIVFYIATNGSCHLEFIANRVIGNYSFVGSFLDVDPHSVNF